jgi:hypothetical protein
MPGGGKVEASGQVRLDATRLDVALVLQQADLAAAQPYLPLRGRVGGKVDGRLAIKGSLTPLAVTATGSVIVADGQLADGQRLLAYAKRLELAGLDADWPRRVSVERIGVQQPWTLVERNADGSIPLLSALEAPVSPASASVTSADSAPCSSKASERASAWAASAGLRRSRASRRAEAAAPGTRAPAGPAVPARSP